MRQRGFTLLEMLVVLVIVAVVTGTLLISRGNDRARNLGEQAARLHEVLELALDQAVLRGREYGLLVREDGYGFAVFDVDERRWEPVVEKPLDPHRLEPDQRLELSLPGTDERQEDPALVRSFIDNATGDQAPGVLLLSSGELTPFRLRLSDPAVGRNPDDGYEIWSDGLQLHLRETR